MKARRERDGRRGAGAAPALFAELDAVYAQADAAHAGWSCPASTECCHFGVTGREPYVTSIELAAVVRAVAALGGAGALRPRLPAGGERRLPLAWDEPDAGRCPLLDARTGRCRIYAARPLGCRTFYCERATAGAPVKQRDVNALVRAIQGIAARHAPDGDRGRPLRRALADALGERRR